MRVINKVIAASGLILIGSSVFAQSLPDAKKAIDAEQYQKATLMLKNLTVTQPTNADNFFYLGWVYLKQDYADSAKAVFDKGYAANPKSALNVVGLGAVDLLNKNQAAASGNFDKAILLAGKDTKPYVYIGRAYLLKPTNAKKAEAAIAVLEKAKTLGGKNPSKDPELFLTLGDAYSADNNASMAYSNYADAETLDPNSPRIKVAKAVVIKGAGNFEDAIKGFQDAIKLDPNYGPAYREMAETDLLQAADPKLTVAKDKEAVDNYKRYLDLTDRSIESRFRYEDFLVYAKDWKTLEQEANDLSKIDSKDLRVLRYLGYAAYENGNYPAAMNAMNTWLSKADPKRIIQTDYVYLGRAQVKTPGQDSLGILTLQKAAALDTVNTDLYEEIASDLRAQKKFLAYANAYKKAIDMSKRPKAGDYFYEGFGYYYAFGEQAKVAVKNKSVIVDSTLLTKADTAFGSYNQKLGKPLPLAILYRARIADLREPADREHGYKGYAKPYYEEYVSIAPATDAAIKNSLIEAYEYLGFYYELVAKDEAKAAENWGKAKELDPNDKQVQAYFTRHSGSAGKSK